MRNASLAVVACALALALATTLSSSAIGAGTPDAAGCAWTLRSNPDTVNIAYPDLDATYWAHFFVPVTGERLLISGEYPSARYFSFHVYDSTAVPIDSAYDQEIAPDGGSSNPFVAKPRPHAGDSYTEYVDFEQKPTHPAPNTIYIADTPQGLPTPSATLMYRVYVPQNPSELQGEVPLPQVTLQTSAGTTLASYGGCGVGTVETGGELNEEIADSNWPAGAPTPEIPGATDPPTWARTSLGDEYAGLFGNQQNAYLSATISRQFGEVVVIHGKAPTFPNTRAGQPAYAKRQVRYWSFCENSNTTRVIACAADYDAALKHGYYTYVVSDPDERPANATAANGVTWLPWGGIFPNGVLIYRNMLPASSFAQAVQSVSEASSPQASMGAYFPSTVYCTRATFEAGGWQACSAPG
jgi:hypothetical protein